MALLLCRIKEAKPNNFFNYFKRSYFQIHTPHLSINQTFTKPISDHTQCFRFTNALKNEGFLDSRVRFFAAPAQFVKKEKEEVLTRPRLNNEIKAGFVRLVVDEGHSVISLREALKRAEELECDLVEVDRKSDPPVCKIMHYKRELYKKQVKIKEKAKVKAAGSLKTGDCKEVRFSAKAEPKDMKVKADSVKRLTERGYRVQCVVPALEGRDIAAVVEQIMSLIEDVALVESGPNIDEKQGSFMVRHIKFGLPKKGKKKVLSTTKSKTEPQSSASSGSHVELEEQQRHAQGSYDDESDLDTEVRSPNFAPNVAENRYAKRVANDASTSRSNDAKGPNFPPNVSQVPQPVNRYAKSNAPPSRSNDVSPGAPQPGNRYARNVPPSNATSPSRSNDVRGPNFPPNATPAPQPGNRYARNVPPSNAASPSRSNDVRGPNFSPNVTPPAPQPGNRYAKNTQPPPPPGGNPQYRGGPPLPMGPKQNNYSRPRQNNNSQSRGSDFTDVLGRDDF